MDYLKVKKQLQILLQQYRKGVMTHRSITVEHGLFIMKKNIPMQAQILIKQFQFHQNLIIRITGEL